eukprot:XP_004916582.2 PREDICTED: RING finger protein 223 [Xenopus tropicalis]
MSGTVSTPGSNKEKACRENTCCSQCKHDMADDCLFPYLMGVWYGSNRAAITGLCRKLSRKLWLNITLFIIRRDNLFTCNYLNKKWSKSAFRLPLASSAERVQSIRPAYCGKVGNKTSRSIMDAPTEIWHTQIDIAEDPDSRLECSICFTKYDNIFKTPKLLQCSHTLCLECVARLVAALPPEKQAEDVLCPFCRQPTHIPDDGAPALQTSQELLSTLPAHLQHEEPVWIEGNKLCYKKPPETNPDQHDLCICVDIGLSKKDSPTEPRQRRGCFRGCSDWKRLLLIAFIVAVLFCILLWPVECILKTGSLRCTSEPVPTRIPVVPAVVTHGV